MLVSNYIGKDTDLGNTKRITFSQLIHDEVDPKSYDSDISENQKGPLNYSKLSWSDLV